MQGTLSTKSQSDQPIYQIHKLRLITEGGKWASINVCITIYTCSISIADVREPPQVPESYTTADKGEDVFKTWTPCSPLVVRVSVAQVIRFVSTSLFLTSLLHWNSNGTCILCFHSSHCKTDFAQCVREKFLKLEKGLWVMKRSITNDDEIWLIWKKLINILGLELGMIYNRISQVVSTFQQYYPICIKNNFLRNNLFILM